MRADRWTFRPLLQGLGVTASILLALGLESAWQYRQDRVQEQVELRRLHSEFLANRVLLDETRAEHERILANARHLLAEMDELRADPTRVIDDPLLSTLWDWQTYDPVQGTLTSLIASGRLDLVENDELRSAITSWPGRVSDLNEDEVSHRSVVRDHFLPFLAGEVSFRRLLRNDLDRFGIPAPPPGADTSLAVLSSREMENWLVDRIQGKANTLRPGGDLDQVLALLEKILELLASEIAGDPTT